MFYYHLFLEICCVGDELSSQAGFDFDFKVKV